MCEIPAWFETPRIDEGGGRLLKKGTAGHILLITWAYMGMIIMFAFTCNLRALYMKVLI